jgi:signal transduction histidine kinase
MSRTQKALRALPDMTMRRLRNTPSYFFLIWRWSMWLYALIVILFYPPCNTPIMHFLLIVTFIQTLIVTLYAPVLQILLPRLSRIHLFRSSKLLSRRQQPLAEDEDPDILTPFVQTRNLYWDIAIYGADVVICGLVVYFGVSGVIPAFGEGSPFERYALSSIFAAALTYRYRGGFAAAVGYSLFVILGILVPPFSAAHNPVTVIDYVGSFVDAPLVAILTGYVATLLANYAQSKRREQDNARTQQALVRVGETLIRLATNRQELLQKSATQIRQGGHFQRLVITLIESPTDDEEDEHIQQPHIRYIEADVDVPDPLLPTRNEALFQRVLGSGKKLATFDPLYTPPNEDYFIARLYVPILKDGQVQLILGVEGRRQTPFNEKQEKFLTISGTQLLLMLDNIRLTEQTIQLAAAAERGRIAREIHDGVAQLVYMLSLNAETCATQAHRIAEASEEDAELLDPLATRLDKMVTISKQALWETRNYMFNLRPLISGTTTLQEMLSNQLREFQAISGLSTFLDVKGVEETNGTGTEQHSRRYAQVGTTIFRIVQEALTNAYKHAEATQIQVHLQQNHDSIEVTIQDNGRGLQTTQYDYDLATDGARERIYSGHGLRGMHERAEELGGKIRITQPASGGVQVWAFIPI